MGQSTTIGCPQTWKLLSLAGLLRSIGDDYAGEFSMFDDQLQVVANDRRWNLIVNEMSDSTAAAEEYASNDDLDKEFRREAVGLRFFVVRFDNLEVTRRLLRAVVEAAVSGNETVWIDTDYGWVISGRDFLHATNKNPLWDWRSAPSEMSRDR